MADLHSRIERHAGGVADLDALSRQLQAAQFENATIGAQTAELRAEVRPLRRHMVSCSGLNPFEDGQRACSLMQSPSGCPC